MYRLTAWLLVFPFLGYAVESAIPRTILAIYDSQSDLRIVDGRIYQYAETPLNHLGFQLLYQDVREGLPDLSDREDIVGVLSWFRTEEELPDPKGYLQWAIHVLDAGKKFVVIGNPGFYMDDEDILTLDEVNRFWMKLGLHDTGRWNTQTYLNQYLIPHPDTVEFERRYQGVLSGYRQLIAVSPDVTSHLLVKHSQDLTVESSLVMTSPRGGYVADDYAVYEAEVLGRATRKWRVNPFLFFRLAFEQEMTPKPDTTTMAGRRIYYSHIDGDGWNNMTMLEEHRNQNVSCTEVIYQRILKPFDDLPCTVAPIGADLDLRWVGTAAARQLAHRLFALPNVEIGCHTFTHPFDWSFFDQYRPQDEVAYFDRYPDGGWNQPTLFSAVASGWRAVVRRLRREPFDYPLKSIEDGYLIPRAYALKPFDLKLEVSGAIEEINRFAPEGKRAVVYQWSGNCLPFEEVLEKVRQADVRNLNGGNSRFDEEYPSYSWVSPLGRKVGKEQQIFASNSNENTYTNMWMGHFYGFNKLPQTFKNTESPIRLRPMNLYYHMYSGERLASVNALLSNIRYIQSQEIIPIHMSQFAGVVEGFYTTEFIPSGFQQWRIVNRGALQTIRFDLASLLSVDMARSRGVIGQRHFQGSLYVYLDRNELEPVVALQAHRNYSELPEADREYLIDSRWQVWNMERQDRRISFTTQGFGEGKMRFKVPRNGLYRVTVSGGGTWSIEAVNGVVELSLPRSWVRQDVTMIRE